MFPVYFWVSWIKVKVTVTVTKQHGGACPVLQTGSCWVLFLLMEKYPMLEKGWNFVITLPPFLFQSVLILGTSLESLAAIEVALSCKSNIYVVMETEDTRAPLLERFGDRIKSKHVLVDKDGLFHRYILQLTCGSGKFPVLINKA